MTEQETSEAEAGSLVSLPLHDIAHAVTTGVMRAVAPRKGNKRQAGWAAASA